MLAMFIIPYGHFPVSGMLQFIFPIQMYQFGEHSFTCLTVQLQFFEESYY